MHTDNTHGSDLYERVGGEDGLRSLANCFYDIMEESSEAEKIREMHPENLDETRENLTLFLCGWLGGPHLYREKHGTGLNLTEVHRLYDIDVEERDSWLSCMEKALSLQAMEEDIKQELMRRFSVPAEKIRSFCQQQFHRTVPLRKIP